MSAINIVVGPPCSGKSTWIASQRGDDEVVVDFDALAQALGSVKSHDPPEEIAAAAFAARAAAMARIFDGLTVDAWIIASFPSVEKLERWENEGCVFHLLDPGLEECLKRAEADNRPAWTVDRIKEWYENPPEMPDGTNVITDPPVEKGGLAMTKQAQQPQIKAKSFAVKAATEEEAQAGIFTGYASVFDNVDSYGDVIRKGAFEESLKQYGPNGAGIPCYWSHQMSDPMKNLGATLEAVEDDHGLLVKVQLDLDNPNAAYVHKLLKEGRATQMSFAYDVIEGRWVEETTDGKSADFFELTKLDIFEVSVVAVGANRATEILDVKAAFEAASASSDSLPAHECVCGSGQKAASKEPAEANEEDSMGNSEEPSDLVKRAKAALAIAKALEIGA